MKKEETYITKSSVETQKLGEEFAKRLPKLIALYGELGSGKTTFTQGLAKGLGINKIISPTFIILRQYKISSRVYFSSGALAGSRNISSRQARTINFYHIDLYRTRDQRDVQDLGIEEIMNNPENIIVIEWAERIKSLLPKNRIDINFEYLDENKRRITIKFKS